MGKTTMKGWGDLKFPKDFTLKWIIIGVFRFSLYFNKMHTGACGILQERYFRISINRFTLKGLVLYQYIEKYICF